MAITLDQVREDFASWRLVRKSRSRTPDPLRKKATDLLETHKLFHVAKALNVGTTELKRWQKQFSPEEGPLQFVEVNVPKPQIRKDVILKLQRHDGMTLSVEGISDQTISSIMHQFLRGASL